MRIPIVVHHRHVHLSKKDMDALFGSPLTPASDLGHKGEHVYKESVAVVGERGILEHVRVLGPARAATQLELSPVEAAALGVDVPVRLSGEVGSAATVTLRGPHGSVRRKCAIVPLRHLHASPDDARRLGIAADDVVTLELERTGTHVEHVVVRVAPRFALECHLSPDEAAQLWANTGDAARLVKGGGP
jgi:putative phosphotransacetylase